MEEELIDALSMVEIRGNDENYVFSDYFSRHGLSLFLENCKLRCAYIENPLLIN